MESLKRGSCYGFTLLELLIVVAIVAVLVSIAIPLVNHNRQQASNASAQSDLRTFRHELEAYFVENNSYPTAN